eukprot:1076966-Alexandrium_andersonii.AAC.1
MGAPLPSPGRTRRSKRSAAVATTRRHAATRGHAGGGMRARPQPLQARTARRLRCLEGQVLAFRQS